MVMCGPCSLACLSAYRPSPTVDAADATAAGDDVLQIENTILATRAARNAVIP